MRTFLGSWTDPSVRLILHETDAAMVEYIDAQVRELPLDDDRFVVARAPLLSDDADAPASRRFAYIANEAHHRFSPTKGSALNRRLHAAAPRLAERTATAHATGGAAAARPGVAYPVELPADCPLRRRCGIDCVIHVCGPNMNPRRPAYLEGDYAVGCAQLSATYAALFECFRRQLDG